MKYIIIILSLVSHCCSAQQLTKQQLTRLSDACKLWGHVKYFHPYLQYKTIPWDSAFAAVVPGILSSVSAQDYEKCLSTWLSILNDPVTKVHTRNKVTSVLATAHPSPTVSIKDSVLTVTINNLTDIKNYTLMEERLRNLMMLPRNIKYIMFDLRLDEFTEGEPLESFFTSHSISALLGSRLMQSSIRTVVHEGFPPEIPYTDEYKIQYPEYESPYFTYFRLKNSHILKTTSERNFPVAFLVNDKVSLPSIALMLQEAGHAIIVSEGKLRENFKNTYINYQIADSLEISMRTADLIINNKVFKLRPDLELTKEEDHLINVQKTIELLKGAYPKSFRNNTPESEVGLTRTDVYPRGTYPSLGYRILAIAKIYTVINYFFPNKSLMDRDWDSVITEFLPRFIEAKNYDEYSLAVLEMYAHIQDGHGFIQGATNWIGQFLGTYNLPVLAKFIENKLVVTIILNDSAARNAGIAVGDIISKINGKNPMHMVDDLRKYLASSNKSTQTARIAPSILLCQKDSMLSKLEIVGKNGRKKTVSLMAQTKNNVLSYSKRRPLDNGPIFKLISSELGYVDLQRLERWMVDSMFNTFRNTKGIIFDMRGYPNGTALDIAPRLTERNYVEAALFTQIDATMPLVNSNNSIVKVNVNHTFIQNLPATTKWRYTGRTVMLMNNATQSQAEYTGLFFKAANGTLFIGSQTAGANGDVTNFNIPGGINLTFSGMNVSYPNGQTMQRIGLIPDVLVLPTIKGIREGRDEVLEKAIEVLQKQ